MTIVAFHSRPVADIFDSMHPEPKTELDVLRAQVQFLARENTIHMRRLRAAHNALGMASIAMFAGGCIGWLALGAPHEDTILFFLPFLGTAVPTALLAHIAPVPLGRKS